MAATVMDTSTASGEAWFSGMQKVSRGTATRASPKPNADRINVAINRMDKTRTVVRSIAISGESGIQRDSLMCKRAAGSWWEGNAYKNRSLRRKLMQFGVTNGWKAAQWPPFVS